MEYHDYLDSANVHQMTVQLFRQFPGFNGPAGTMGTGRATPGPRGLVNVPSLPPHYLPRPEDLAALSDLVLGSGSSYVGVTAPSLWTGIQGMGGIGKSVMAAALVREPALQAAFPDGIFWVTLGQTPVLTSLHYELARTLGPPVPATPPSPNMVIYRGKGTQSPPFHPEPVGPT